MSRTEHLLFPTTWVAKTTPPSCNWEVWPVTGKSGHVRVTLWQILQVYVAFFQTGVHIVRMSGIAKIHPFLSAAQTFSKKIQGEFLIAFNLSIRGFQLTGLTVHWTESTFMGSTASVLCLLFLVSYWRNCADCSDMRTKSVLTLTHSFRLRLVINSKPWGMR